MNDPQGFRFRAMPRAPFSAEVELRVEATGELAVGEIIDIGSEGTLVECDLPVSLGMPVYFQFVSPEGSRVAGLADVVWVREPGTGSSRPRGLGLQFRYLEPATRSEIDRLVELARALQVAGSATGEMAALDAEAQGSPAGSPLPDLAPRRPPTRPRPTPTIPVPTPTIPVPTPLSEPGDPDDDLPGRPAITETSEIFVRNLKDPWGQLEPNPASMPGEAGADYERYVPPRTGFPWLLVGAGTVLVLALVAWWWWTLSSVAPPATDHGLAPESSRVETTATLPETSTIPEPRAAAPGEEPATQVAATQVAATDVAATDVAATDVAVLETSPEPDARSPEERVAPSAPARLLRIQLLEDSEVETLLLLGGEDGAIPRSAVSTLELESPARFLIKVSGIEAEVGGAVASRRVRRTRSAVHQEAQGPTVHLVLDLATGNVRASAEHREGQLLIRLTDG